MDVSRGSNNNEIVIMDRLVRLQIEGKMVGTPFIKCGQTEDPVLAILTNRSFDYLTLKK